MIFFNDPFLAEPRGSGAAADGQWRCASESETPEIWRKRGHHLDLGVGIAAATSLEKSVSEEGASITPPLVR